MRPAFTRLTSKRKEVPLVPTVDPRLCGASDDQDNDDRHHLWAGPLRATHGCVFRRLPGNSVGVERIGMCTYWPRGPTTG